MINLTHGIVTDTHVLYYSPTDTGMRFVQQPIDTAVLTSIGSYIDIANQYQLSQLWILPGTNVSATFATYDDTFVTSSLDAYRVFPTELASYMEGRHKNRPGTEVSLLTPAYIDGLPGSVTHMGDAKSLYAYVTYLQTVLGITFVRDAKGTGIELLRSVNTRGQRSDFLRGPTSDMTPFYEHKSIDLQWSRALTDDEKRLQHVHVIDRNYMYLAGTSGLHVGAGDYQYQRSNGSRDIQFNKKQPGIWHVTVVGTPDTSTLQVPYVLPRHTDMWLDTALVQVAIDAGYWLRINEAYTFPDSHMVFNPWYTVLRDALTALTTDAMYKNETARTAAIDTIKMLYRQTIGLIGRQPETGENHKWYSRPDAFNAVVAESKKRMHITIQQLHNANVRIVGCYVDALYVVSDKELDQLLPDQVVISQQIGKYKHAGTYPVRDVADMFTDNPQTMVKGLAHYKRETLQNG